MSSNIAFAFVCASIYIMQFNVSLQYLFDNRLYSMDGSQNLFNDQQKIESFEIKYLSFKNDILVDFS